MTKRHRNKPRRSGTLVFPVKETKLFLTKYSGLVSMFFIWQMLIIVYIFKRELIAVNDSLSELGSIPETENYFKFSLITASIFIYIFAIRLISEYKIKNGSLLWLLLTTLGAHLTGIALVPVGINRTLHWFFAVSFFVQLTLVIFLLGQHLKKVNKELAFVTNTILMLGLTSVLLTFVTVDGLTIPTFLGFLLVNCWVSMFYLLDKPGYNVNLRSRKRYRR